MNTNSTILEIKRNFYFPGSFSPPTYGHYRLVMKAMNFLPELTIICSKNENKTDLFNEEESKQLWQFYDLPENVRVLTFEESLKEKTNLKDIVMIRGIRNEKDAEYEKEIMIRNKKNFGIEQYFYIYSDCQDKHISSSYARKSAQENDIQTLRKLVAPQILTALMNRIKHHV